MSDESTSLPPETRGPGRGTVVFLVLLVAAGVVLAGLSAFRAATPEQPPPDFGREAMDYLRSQKAAPLSGSLTQLLTDPQSFVVKTQAHPLLDKPAPAFDLRDPDGVAHKLSDLRTSGPVVLVFYYGYYCNHCVSQLFDLNEEIKHFRELKTEVVAISADPPELTRKRYARYGSFAFTVLSDPGKEIAKAYHVYTPAEQGKEDSLDHATFVIDREGMIRWAQQSDTPFNGTRTLLYEVARLEGRLPDSKTPGTGKSPVSAP